MDDVRVLRSRLEDAQAEVKRLSRALTDAKATRHDGALAREVARLEGLVAHAKDSRRQLEAHWRERERDWQARERALAAQVEVLGQELRALRKHAARLEAYTAKQDARLARLQAQRPAPRLVATLQTLLADRDSKAQVQALLREVARLKRQVSLQQPRLRR